MGVGSTLYDVVLVLHLMAAIVGFGTVFLNGVYGAQAKKRQGAGGVAIGEAMLAVTQIAQYAIYTVPVWGILLVVLSDDTWEFSQAWISLSFLLFFVVVGLSHGVMRPSARRMNALAAELVAAGPPPGGGRPPQVAEMETVEKRLGVVGGILNLLVVALVALMVFKPGA